MAILRVARIGHPVLRQVALPVPSDQLSTPEIQGLIRDMLETVEEYDGAGLAAPQVHRSVRIVVLRLQSDEDLRVWVNPVLTPTTDRLTVTMEGCLSVPGLRGAVPRPSQVHVQALERDGSPVDLLLSGFPAVVAQHECDHLDGVIYIDRILPRSLGYVEEHRRYGSPLARGEYGSALPGEEE